MWVIFKTKRTFSTQFFDSSFFNVVHLISLLSKLNIKTVKDDNGYFSLFSDIVKVNNLIEKIYLIEEVKLAYSDKAQ